MPRNSLVGQILGGRYRVDEMVGQGGMAAVYKAYDPNLKRVVAIKTMHSHLADDPRFLTRFEEEATAVAQLRHPNIVQVFDFDHDGDLYYMVQEFVVGETLRERLRRLKQAGKRMPLADAIQVVLDTAEAASYAHRRGLIHRDIKPANIMLDVNDRAILMDFGIVKLVGAEHHTATGSVLGTPLYMPPEVVQGETPDARSDLYSLGVTLYEVLSGRPPFEADSSMRLMMMHVQEPVPDLRALRPEVPQAVVAVIDRALAKRREGRYGSMAELGAALKQALASTQAEAVPGAMAHLSPPTAAASSAGRAAPSDYGGNVVPAAGGRPLSGGGSQRETPGAKAAPVRQRAGGGVPPFAASGPAPARRVPKPALWIGGALLAVTVVVALLLVLLSLPGGGNGTPKAEAQSPGSSQQPVPTARITGIALDSQQHYVVGYETSGFTEALPGRHLHFFFDTVPPEQAGEPGKGPWTDYGGPSPFVQIKQSERPENADKLCVLVANADHTVQPGSGMCSTLPGVVTAMALQDMACLAGPASTFPPVAQLKAGEVVPVLGVSPDEGWWNVENPQKPDETCWLSVEATQPSGNVSGLPVVEGQPLPSTAAPGEVSVELLHIGLDGQGRYVVDFRATGFTPQLPGTHIHFFFDTVPPEQVGTSGGNLRLMYGGPSPFTGYSRTDRPAEAVRMCALVANPDDSVVPGSGNCLILPDAP